MHKQATRALRKARNSATVGAKSLPQKYFVSPEVFADEQHKIFAEEWLLVGQQSQIPNAGDFFIATIANESLIVVRDQQSQIRAFYNVCRHRGSRLKEETCGHTSAIQCPYHVFNAALGIPDVIGYFAKNAITNHHSCAAWLVMIEPDESGVAVLGVKIGPIAWENVGVEIDLQGE